ncbi:hypothetical protein HPO96_07635 [Kribbella sandramycini]|uniref:Uncharacterized protein n=1 Tax=Kribbella sandramycini TaxID=60450 RepID=A0A7Y4KYQ7_9ACTN|nr:hypothetical protein [Kribbella sandramycini]MBB6567276.1 hypothetical protein [Kribbella sandramycini]NOL40111.1 hypothetical protein [Kribbella sandramycini]
MLTTDESPRRRWLRRASVAAATTAVLGIGTAGLSVAVVSARYETPPASTSSVDSSPGIGSAPSGSTSQGGSNGS